MRPPPVRPPVPLAPLSPQVCTALSITRTTGGDGVALTFDDGPPPEGTPALMEVLAAAGATATFFLVGEQVERRPALAAEIVAAGHEVALHGHRHRAQLLLRAHAIAEDLDRGATVVEEAVRVRVA